MSNRLWRSQCQRHLNLSMLMPSNIKGIKTLLQNKSKHSLCLMNSSTFLMKCSSFLMKRSTFLHSQNRLQILHNSSGPMLGNKKDIKITLQGSQSSGLIQDNNKDIKTTSLINNQWYQNNQLMRLLLIQSNIKDISNGRLSNLLRNFFRLLNKLFYHQMR